MNNSILKLSKPVFFGLALILTVVLGLLDFITGTVFSFSFIYIVPVVLCTWYIHKWAGLAIAFESTLVWFLADYLSPSHLQRAVLPGWNLLELFASFSVIVFILSSFKRDIDRENARANEIQLSLLPKKIPKIPGYDIAAVWRPASHVSGDYYDVVVLEDSAMGLCIGDVSGKGVPAALLMSSLQAAFRILSMNTRSPRELCDQLNKFIVKNSKAESFISFFYGILDTENKVLHYTNAGHPPPIVLRQNGDIHRLSTDGLIFGITDNFISRHASIQLEKNDVVLLYTDGMIEAVNQLGEYFGEEGLINSCKTHFHKSAKGICSNVMSTMSVFTNDITYDDVTLMVIKVH